MLTGRNTRGRKTNINISFVSSDSFVGGRFSICLGLIVAESSVLFLSHPFNAAPLAMCLIV